MHSYILMYGARLIFLCVRVILIILCERNNDAMVKPYWDYAKRTSSGSCACFLLIKQGFSFATLLFSVFISERAMRLFVCCSGSMHFI